MLIETPEGIVNTDHIVSVRGPDCGDDPGGTILFVDGSTRSTRDLGLFEEACGVIVPAGPGFEVVTAWFPDAERGAIRYTFAAVIAFRVGAGYGDAEPVPITTTGRPGMLAGTIWTLRQPNGSCAGPEGAHGSLDAFMADCQRQAERSLAGSPHRRAEAQR